MRGAQRFATTYVLPGHSRWADATIPVDVRRLGRLRALRTLAAYDGPVIANGAVPASQAYVDLLAAGVLKRRGKTLIIPDATWEPGSRAIDRGSKPLDYQPPATPRRLVRWGLPALIDGPNTHYAVWSRHEEQTFGANWGVDPARVHFVPFSATTADVDTVSPGGGGIFAGGNSLRDYRGLIGAAPSLDMPVTIATTLPTGNHPGVNIGPLSKADYDAASLRADIVVVALLDGTERSAGQQTFLNAMLRGQATVVTRAPGVEDYIEHGKTALIVENDAEALASAIGELVASPERRRELGAAGRAAVLDRYKVTDLYDRMLDLAERVTAR